MATYDLALGARRIAFPMRAGVEWEVLEPVPVKGAGSPSVEGVLERVLADPPKPGARVAIVVPDYTRPAPVGDAIPLLARALEKRGVPEARQTVIVASGTHAAPALDELRRAWGLPEGLTLAANDARAPGVKRGVTRAGTPVELDERYANADWRVTLGGVSFHYFAGFGGGPKMVFPGVASRDGAAANHKLSLGPLPPGGLHPACGPGVIEGNPVAEDIAEAAALDPPQAAIHVVPEARGWTYEAGDDGQARAREVVRARGAVGEAGAYDVVVASAGGSPRDGDVVQAQKALAHAARYARPGGTVILLAETASGLGSATLDRWLSIEDGDELERQARSAYDLNAQTAVSFRSLARRHRVFWVGSKSPRWIRLGGAEAIDAGPGIERALDGARGRGALLPIATAVVPRASLDDGRGPEGRPRT